MDWYTWLRRGTIDPPCAAEYALLFSRNELEEEDIEDFNHEFLLSMGISIAKHRLKILRLAKKERKKTVIAASRTISTLLSTVRKVKTCFARYVEEMVGRDRSAIAVVPMRRDATMSSKNKKKRRYGKVTTDGHSPPLLPMIGYRRSWTGDGVGISGRSSNSSEDEGFKWNSMFDDLNPT